MSDSQIERWTSIPAPVLVLGPLAPKTGAVALKALAPLRAFTPIFSSVDGGGNLIAGEAVADGTTAGNCIGFTTGGTSAAEAIEYSIIGALVSTIVVVVSSLSSTSDPPPPTMPGLIPGRVYYLDQSEPGKITNVAPTSGQVVQLGTAFAPTGLALQISQPSAAPISSGGVEHLPLSSGGTVAADPAKAVTFVDGGAHGAVTLADGLSDGFEKTIITTFLADGNVTITPASGQAYTIPAGFAGAITFRWDGVTTNSWYATAIVNAT